MTLGATRGPIEYKAKGILGNQSLFILQLFDMGQQSSNCIVLLWRRRDGEHRQRGREWFSEAEHTHTTESKEKRDEWRSERECLNFGLNRLEPAISVVSADTSWVGANQPDSARIRLSLSRIGASRRKKKKPRGRRGSTRHWHAVSGVPRAMPRRTRVRRLWSRVCAFQMPMHLLASSLKFKPCFCPTFHFKS